MRRAFAKPEFEDISMSERGEVRDLVRKFKEEQQRPVLAGREGRQQEAGGGQRRQPRARKVQRRLWHMWKDELEKRYRLKYQRERFTLRRLDSARGRVASGYLTCLPRGEATTLTDAEFSMNTRLRLGVPVSHDLPEQCVCGESLSDCYTHLLACRTLCERPPNQHGGAKPGTRNWWDLRHTLVNERLSADLVSAGTAVVIEPGRLDPRPDGVDSRPDQLITYAAAGRQDGLLRRVTTDITVREAVTESVVARGEAVARTLERWASEKRLAHEEASRAAGCAFVPLVFTSLGAMHPGTEKFLKLDDMALDERQLQRLGGGRQQFVARVHEGLSCAVARGNARMLFYVCAELPQLRNGERAEAAAQPRRAA
jgi:hypothetical protein